MSRRALYCRRDLQCPFCNNINIPAWSHSSLKYTLSCECTEVASSHNSQSRQPKTRHPKEAREKMPALARDPRGCRTVGGEVSIADFHFKGMRICLVPCSAYCFSCELHELQEIVMMGRLAGQNSESCEGRRRLRLPEVSLSQQRSFVDY